jgi:16S rRNA (guanine1207-N2)-methyltransferase
MNHYFTNDNNLKSNMHLMEIKIFDKVYSLYTDNGVFSKNGLDFGTRFLLEKLPIDNMNGNILDVGCGYGPIGIILKKETNCSVDMVDINLRALHLAKLSAKQNKIDVNVFESDAYRNVNDKYDYIITNPPIRAGKKKVYEILIGASEFLKDNGELWFVIRKDQGAKSTLLDISKYYNVNLVDKKNGFFIVCATKLLKNVDNT